MEIKLNINRNHIKLNCIPENKRRMRQTVKEGKKDKEKRLGKKGGGKVTRTRKRRI